MQVISYIMLKIFKDSYCIEMKFLYEAIAC